MNGVNFPKAMWMFPFKVFDFAVVGAGVTCVVALLTKYYSTYEVEKDNFGIQIFDRWDLLPKDGSFRLRPLAAASTLLRELLHYSGISYAPPTHHTISLVTHASMKQCQQWHYSHSWGRSSMTSEWILSWHLLW